MDGNSPFFVGVVVGIMISAILAESGDRRGKRILPSLRIAMMVSALVALGVAVFA
jgi:hypothetical protein